MIQESLKPEVGLSGRLYKLWGNANISIKLITHLDEDGLELWLCALRNDLNGPKVPPVVPSLLDLAPVVLDLLARNLDLLGTIVSIIEAYFLLDAPGLLQVINKIGYTRLIY